MVAMTNSKVLFNELKSNISIDESPSEIESILFLLFEKKFGLTKSNVLLEKQITITDDLPSIIHRINNHEPIQYILAEADFFGRSFYVDKHVLIPRPETELLVEEAINQLKHERQNHGTILDIGTGSGCIAITLAKEFVGKKVIAIDASVAAIEVAKKNANFRHANIDFVRSDILIDDLSFQQIECIVSNPPYIAKSEISSMNKNVTDYEPSLALFVDDNDPLIFYKRIALLAGKGLTHCGKLLVEINERFGNEVASLFEINNFKQIEIKKDLDGKDRIVMGVLK